MEETGPCNPCHVSFLTVRGLLLLVSFKCSFFWLNFLMRVPGTKATKAMANNFKMVSQEKIASREVRVDRMEPVCTQMKLYGIKPGKGESKKICYQDRKMNHHPSETS